MAKDTEIKKSESSTKAAKPAKKKKPNPIVKYFKDLKIEFKKVVWPSKKKVLNNTMVVLVTMALSGIFIWLFDMGATALLNLMLQKSA